MPQTEYFLPSAPSVYAISENTIRFVNIRVIRNANAQNFQNCCVKKTKPLFSKTIDISRRNSHPAFAGKWNICAVQANCWSSPYGFGHGYNFGHHAQNHGLLEHTTFSNENMFFTNILPWSSSDAELLQIPHSSTQLLPCYLKRLHIFWISSTRWFLPVSLKELCYL